ncbi:MAG: uroporphyrinogen-III C-methyltransferase [Alphaproteobacteria bacterium]
MTGRLAMPVFEAGTVWLVGAGPGDPGLLTLHALHALSEADVVLHDALVPSDILALINPLARVEPVGKRAGRPSAKQLQISHRLVKHAAAGCKVVRLKNGDPFVFGRGGEEVLALAAASIPFRIVPGITAGVAVPAYAGIPATQRNVAQSVAFVTGHHAGGGVSRTVDWAGLAKAADTLVIYMGLQQIGDIARALIEGGRSNLDPVAFLTDGTTPMQRRIVTTLAEAPAVAKTIDASGPTLVVIGDVVDFEEILSPLQQSAPAIVETLQPEATPALPAALNVERGLS